jgi:hypothetical protein
MSDIQGATEEIQKLQLDEVTGERVSKTELKKRQKAREKEAKKAEKEASKQPPPPPKRKAVSQDEEESNLPANVSQAIPLPAISNAIVLHSARLHETPLVFQDSCICLSSYPRILLETCPAVSDCFALVIAC